MGLRRAVALSRAVPCACPQLAHKYCSDCRRDFDDLSKVIQKVLASRRELLRYDRQARDGAGAATTSAPAFCQVSVSYSYTQHRALSGSGRGRRHTATATGASSCCPARIAEWRMTDVRVATFPKNSLPAPHRHHQNASNYQHFLLTVAHYRQIYRHFIICTINRIYHCRHTTGNLEFYTTD